MATFRQNFFRILVVQKLALVIRPAKKHGPWTIIPAAPLKFLWAFASQMIR